LRRTGKRPPVDPRPMKWVKKNDYKQPKLGGNRREHKMTADENDEGWQLDKRGSLRRIREFAEGSTSSAGNLSKPLECRINNRLHETSLQICDVTGLKKRKKPKCNRKVGSRGHMGGTGKTSKRCDRKRNKARIFNVLNLGEILRRYFTEKAQKKKITQMSLSKDLATRDSFMFPSTYAWVGILFASGMGSRASHR